MLTLRDFATYSRVIIEKDPFPRQRNSLHGRTGRIFFAEIFHLNEKKYIPEELP